MSKFYEQLESLCKEVLHNKAIRERERERRMKS